MFAPKKKEPINFKKTIKFIGVIISLYVFIVLLPYYYMKNQFADFMGVATPFIATTLSGLPLTKDVNLSPGCSIDPFFYTPSSTVKSINNIELIEASFGDGDVDQSAKYSATVQLRKQKIDLVIRVQKLLDGQIRLCSLYLDKNSKSDLPDSIHDKVSYERNMHFDGDLHAKFKRWLDKEQIPYSTYTVNGEEYISWDERYSLRVKKWPYFPPDYWDRKSKGSDSIDLEEGK